LIAKGEKVFVHIKYKSVEQKFEGAVEEVWILLGKFFSEFVPSFDAANKLHLSVDIVNLTRNCEGLIAFSSEGANLLVPKNLLTDFETLSLWLLSSYVGFRLGFMGSETMSKGELQTRLGKSGKITSTRLGELVKNDFVIKTSDDCFRLSTFGVLQLQRDVLPRVHSKMLG
jgi:hypothetical protein